MNWAAIGFGVAAAVCWGVAPVLSKRGFTTGGTPAVAAFMFVCIGTVGLWSLSLVVYDPERLATALTPAAVAPFVVGGVAGTGIGRLLNYYGVERLGASVNSAVVATDPVFAALLGLVALGEALTIAQLGGVLLVAGGLAVTALSGGGNRRGWPRRALVIPVGAAVAYGGGAVVRRFGLGTTTTTPIQAAAINETAALVVIGGYLYYGVDRPSAATVGLDSYLYLLAAGVVNTAGLVALFASLQAGPVVIGSTLAGTSTLVTIAIAAVVLRQVEAVTHWTAVGGLVTVVGGLLVVTG
jgi:drug/metabolite transporter (DMT)-like permease